MRSQADSTGQEDVSPNRESAPNGLPEGTEAVQQLFRRIGELLEHFTHYLGVRKDLAAAKARRVLLKLIAAAAAAVVLAAIVFTAAGLVVVGIAHGLGTLFGNRMWLGELVTGAGLLAMMAAALWILLGKWRKDACQRTIQKYEGNSDAVPEPSHSIQRPEVPQPAREVHSTSSPDTPHPAARAPVP